MPLKYHWLPAGELEVSVVTLALIVGVAGAGFTVTLNVRAGDDPQVLFAVTVILPLVPIIAAVVVITLLGVVPFTPPGARPCVRGSSAYRSYTIGVSVRTCSTDFRRAGDGAGLGGKQTCAESKCMIF